MIPHEKEREPPSEDVETLRVIYEVTRGEYDAIMSTCSALDTKGGVVFGLAGALIIGILSTSPNEPSAATNLLWGPSNLVSIGACLSAGVSLFAAVWSLRTRPYRSHSTKNVSSPKYYTMPIAGTLAHFNQELVGINDSNRKINAERTRWLKWSLKLLVVAFCITLVHLVF